MALVSGRSASRSSTAILPCNSISACQKHGFSAKVDFRGRLPQPKSLVPAFGSVIGCRKALVVHAAGDKVEVEEPKGEILPSGEWPENFSMLNFEDLSAHYESVIFKEEAQPSTFLADVMSKIIYTATPENLIEEIDHFFTEISGVPVIDKEQKCIGVFSKKDKSKALNGLKSTVGEVMSSPAITLSADKTVSDAAILMLKNKIHRIPIVNDSDQVVGIVTRTDIFTALEGST